MHRVRVAQSQMGRPLRWLPELGNGFGAAGRQARFRLQFGELSVADLLECQLGQRGAVDAQHSVVCSVCYRHVEAHFQGGDSPVIGDRSCHALDMSTKLRDLDRRDVPGRETASCKSDANAGAFVVVLDIGSSSARVCGKADELRVDCEQPRQPTYPWLPVRGVRVFHHAGVPLYERLRFFWAGLLVSSGNTPFSVK